MNIYKRFLIAKLCLWLALLSALSPMNANAQALPTPQPERVSRSISGALQQGMQSRGFARNDPRFMNTIARISPQLSAVAGGTIAAVTVGTVTAPAWISMALAIGAGAVITYAVQLGLDSLISWYLRDDGLIDETSKGLDPATVPGTLAGQFVWCTNQGAGGGCASSGEAMARQAADDLVKATNSSYSGLSSITCTLTNETSLSCGTKYTLKSNGSIANGAVIYVYRQTGATACPGGNFYRSGACKAMTFSAQTVKTSLTPAQAVNGLSSTELDKQLNPALVAALANSAWKKAASAPDYDGLPYQQSNPITAAEVQAWLQANPQFAPSVRDFVSPNPSTSTATQPWALPVNPTAQTTSPALTTNAETVNPASQNPLTNLGPDPGIGAPQLEATPTAQQILSPILNLLPNHKNFTATAQAGVCPTPTINLYGTHVMNAHCSLIDSNKSVIQTAMLFAWSAIALFVVLSA